MNCKPGDLAVIVRCPDLWSKFRGRIVQVLRIAPTHTFKLPDGYVNEGCPANVWLCELQSPMTVPLAGGLSCSARYVCIRDAALRPIRDTGDDAQDETLQWLPVPSKMVEPA